MRYQYFLASRYRNKEAVLDLARKVKAKGKSYYCFIESEASIKNVGSVESDPEAAMKQFESIPDWTQDARVREVFEMDMNSLKDSETIVVLLPAGKSVHIEAGAAYGLGKRVILVGEQKEAESLYLIFDEFYPSVDAFIESLKT